MVLRWELTVTASASVRAREDLRTYSTKLPEGGRRGRGSDMYDARVGGRKDRCDREMEVERKFRYGVGIRWLG